MILISGESVSESGSGGSESRDVVSDRMQLVMPPRIELAQIFGAALWSAKTALAGRAGGVWGTPDLRDGASRWTFHAAKRIMLPKPIGARPWTSGSG